MKLIPFTIYNSNEKILININQIVSISSKQIVLDSEESGMNKEESVLITLKQGKQIFVKANFDNLFLYLQKENYIVSF